MTYPSHDFDGLEVPPSSDPFEVFLENGNSELEDDVNECIEDENFNDIDLY